MLTSLFSSNERQLDCVECGGKTSAKSAFLSPDRQVHCARCVMPGPIDRLLQDTSWVKGTLLKAFVLAALVFGVFSQMGQLP